MRDVCQDVPKEITDSTGFITKDSGKRVEYDSGMRRDTNDGKIDYTLCDMSMFKRWAALMTRGKKKYGKLNWAKANSKEELERFYESAYRHFISWLLGEIDEDHAAAIFFNVAAAEYVKEKLKNGTS
jgi:hypothetical protein